ncbi:MAG: hypothetical protein ACKO24_10000 [Leptolyngbyaceae cyanobacterium]
MLPYSPQLDPLNSPHPIPWNWVQATLNSQVSAQAARLHSYRSLSLVSPDGRYAAYSRIQLRVMRSWFQSQVSSLLFLENLETGDLQPITPSSPLADNPFLEQAELPDGRISMIVPVSWSAESDRLLAREFESLFSSDIASDYAVMVDCRTRQVSTVAPTALIYTHAILLGWSQAHPDRALFMAGNLGEEDWPLWTVAVTGETKPAPGDHPLILGQTVNHLWMGPQVQS